MSAQIDLTQVNTLRARVKTVYGQIELQHSAQALWPYITNSDILDKKIGLSAVEYTFEPSDSGGSYIHAQTVLGTLKTTYTELAYQWLPAESFSVERIVHRGWLRYLRIKWQLHALSTGGCSIEIHFDYVPRYPLIPLKPSIKHIVDKMLHFFKTVDAAVPEHHLLGFEAFFEKNPSIEQKISELFKDWSYLMPEHELPKKVAEFIYTAPDKQVYTLRPFEVADYFNLPRLEVLTFCLLATKAGFLDLSWDVLCPSCRGSRTTATHLWQLNTQTHCDVCNIDYDAHFDHNVEVTFRPKDKLRQLDTQIYCIANPAATGHIWAQIRLDPYETRALQLYLPPGGYRLYSLSLPGELIIHVSEHDQAQSIQLDLDEQFAEQTELPWAKHTPLNLYNPNGYWITLKVEKLNDYQRVATAALVTSLQDFRDLFSSAEVLRPNMQLGISNIVILFSDLVGSTQIYERHGDANAFSLVQQHFDIMTPIIRQHQGGIVKTIGDAVMAVFTESTRAIHASLDILQAFKQRNLKHTADEAIIIKLGLHKGPCIVLNLNDKLDYFGNTVNKAARIQAMSQGNDVVISDLLFQELEALLTDYPGLNQTAFSAELKGLQHKSNLYRLYFT